MFLLQEIYFKESKKDSDIWYHGTPDVRDLEKEGGFTGRTDRVTYVSDPQELKRIEKEMAAVRDKDMDRYYELMDDIAELKKVFTIKSPVFLTDEHGVAKTYADPMRAFDHQGAEEKVLKVKVDPGNNIKIMAPGDRFRFININKTKQGFMNAGVSEEEFDEVLSMFNFYIQDNKGIQTDLVAAMGQWFGFDSIDVIGVLDSYHGGTTKSTVRMVFDPSSIKIV